MSVRSRRPSTSLRWVCLLIVASGIAIATQSVALAAEEARLAAPQALGPYPVGVTTMVLVDHSRTDEASKGPRTLATEIWYPAADETRDLPANKFSDFLFRGQVVALRQALEFAFKTPIDEVDGRFINHSVRDARVRDGKFPLIVFSHGNGGIRNQSTFWCDHMASHGYIVVSPDHTGNSAATVVDGRVVTHNSKKRDASAKDRPLDVSFLIDVMEKMNAGADSRFAGRVDLEHIGVAGHSFGGFTAGAVTNTDKRVKAIITMTPVFGERTNYDVPVLMLLGAEDKTIGVEGNARARKYYDETKAARCFVDILDAGHFSFSDMYQFRPEYGDGVGKGERVTKPGEAITYLPMDKTYEIANSYSVAFFGAMLKGQDDYVGFISTNNFPGVIEHAYAAAGEGAAETAAAGGDAAAPASEEKAQPAEAKGGDER